MPKRVIRNFDCPLTSERCTNEKCRRDKCMDQQEAEWREKVASGQQELEQQRIRELYEAFGVDVPPGKLTPPKISK
ncbi:MAG: hypothetical protein ACHQRJ_22055 [Alphaproteobacteria bacterium]